MFPAVKNDQLTNKEPNSPTYTDDGGEESPHKASDSSDDGEYASEKDKEEKSSIYQSPQQKSKKSHRKNVSNLFSPTYGYWSTKRITNQGSKTSLPSNNKEADYLSQRVQSARNLKIHELSNEIEDMRRQMRDLEQENRLLKNELIRHERNLSKLPGARGDIQDVLKSHQDEVHALRMLLNQLKEKKREFEKKLRAKDMQIYKQQKEIQQLTQLNKERQLPERKELWKKVEALKEEINQRDKTNEELSRRIEIATKALKQDLSNEISRHKETQQRLNHLQVQHEKLQSILREKQKELDRRNIYSNTSCTSSAPCRPTSSASTATPSNFTTKQILSSGSLSEHSSFSDEPVKPTYCPSVHGGGSVDFTGTQKHQKEAAQASKSTPTFHTLMPSLTDDDKVQTKTELPEKELPKSAPCDKKIVYNYAATVEDAHNRPTEKRKAIVIRNIKSSCVDNGGPFRPVELTTSETMPKSTYVLSKYSNGQCTLSCTDQSEESEPKKEKLSEESKQILLAKLKNLDQEKSEELDGYKKGSVSATSVESKAKILTKKSSESSEHNVDNSLLNSYRPSFHSSEACSSSHLTPEENVPSATTTTTSSFKGQKKKHDLMATLFGNEIVQCPVSPVKKVDLEKKPEDDPEFEWLGKKPSSGQSFKRIHRPSNGWVELSNDALRPSSSSEVHKVVHHHHHHQDGTPHIPHMGTVDVATDIDGNTFKVHRKSDHAFGTTRCMERDKYGKGGNSYYALKSSEV